MKIGVMTRYGCRNCDFSEKYIHGFSLDLIANTPEEFAAAIRADVESAAEMVKAAGVLPE